MNDQTGGEDYSAAVPLEISQETAERAEEVLRAFAEDAEMDMALIVDRSGSLVAGIAADAGVSVETISALVAGVCGAVDALVGEIGDSGEIESFHSGGERQMYLKELENRFILVGVSNADLPTGIIRQKSAQVREELTAILQDIQASSAAAAAQAKRRRSLHSIAPRKPVAEPEITLESEEDLLNTEEVRPEIVLEASEVDEPLVSLDAVGDSPFSLESEPEGGAQGEGIRFDDLSGLTDPSDEGEVEDLQEEKDEELPAEDFVESEKVSFEIDESAETSEPEISEEIEEKNDDLADLISGAGLEDEDKVLLNQEEEPEAEAEPESAPEPVSSPPVLVKTVVVDSPFEAVDDEDENLEMESDAGQDEEVLLPSQPGPSIGKSGAEGAKLNLPLPSKPAPESADTSSESEEDEPEPRKSGPRYSFELG